MQRITGDVAILGAGFGGSLTALVLERLGLRPVLIDRSTHPRFAIGESSTPLADLALQQLARRYNLPRIAPLAEYGSWQRTYPELPCGLKRGFSYFDQRPGKRLQPSPDHTGELLFAASLGADDADTHWYRPRFDEFLAQEACAAGVPLLDGAEIQELGEDREWHVRGVRNGEPFEIRAPFVIDASGDGCVLARHLKLTSEPESFHTNSRALFAHFTGVGLYHDVLASAGAIVADHPYPCDDAVVHHILDGGWMWVIPFNNGITSAGFMLDRERHPLDPSLSPEVEWQQLMEQYPAVAVQFAEARVAPSCGTLRRTGRIQRRVRQAAGPNWAMLPLTAYALDAMHSTGNAHNLCGIERLAEILKQPASDERTASLQDYNSRLQSEITFLDALVHGCYLGFSHFKLLAAFVMLYFAGATNSEVRRRRCGDFDPESTYLIAHDAEFRDVVFSCHASLEQMSQQGRKSPADIAAFERYLAERVEPFNIAGLCDPSRKGMYPYPESCARPLPE